MKITKKTLFVLTVAILFFASCEPNPTPPNEDELITTVIYTLTPVGSEIGIEMSFKDIDGDGGIDPIIIGGTLEASKTYDTKIKFLNESVSPSEDITNEISNEKEAHQIFYSLSSTIKNIATAKVTDTDKNGKPLGLKSNLITTGKGIGNITITLRHEPNKSAAGVASGDITNAGGETDIEVTFPVTIK